MQNYAYATRTYTYMHTDIHIYMYTARVRDGAPTYTPQIFHPSTSVHIIDDRTD